MYTYTNYKTKKALKDAVAAGKQERVYQPSGMFDLPESKADYTGRACCEGPHYPEPHRWYAEVELTNGVITKVK